MTEQAGEVQQGFLRKQEHLAPLPIPTGQACVTPSRQRLTTNRHTVLGECSEHLNVAWLGFTLPPSEIAEDPDQHEHTQ